MKKDTLKSATTEELKKKEKSLKTLIGLFIPIILALFYFGIKDYINGTEVDLPITIIAICSVGGMITLFPELKQVKEELNNRDQI